MTNETSCYETGADLTAGDGEDPVFLAVVPGSLAEVPIQGDLIFAIPSEDRTERFLQPGEDGLNIRKAVRGQPDDRETFFRDDLRYSLTREMAYRHLPKTATSLLG